MFGKGRYALSHLRLPSGDDVQIAKISDAQQRELLSKASGDVEYVTKAALLRTQYEINDFIKKFYELYTLFPEQVHSESLQVTIDTQSTDMSINIDIDQFEALIDSRVHADRLFSVELMQDKKPVGYLFFLNSQVSIFSTENLTISGENGIASLFVNTIGSVTVQKKLIVDNDLHVHSQTLQINSAADDILIQAKAIEFVTFQQAQINGVIKADQIILKAGYIIIKKMIECAQDNLSILAETVDAHSNLLAKNKLIIVALDLRTHSKTATSAGAHLHASDIAILAANEAELDGNMSSCVLKVFGRYITLHGSSYTQDNALFHVFGRDSFIKANKESAIYCGKSFSQNSENCSWLDGHVKQNPNLKVYWKNVINPFQLRTDDQILHGSKYNKFKSLLGVEAPAAIELLPYIESGKPQLYDETSFAPLANTECKLQALPSRIEVSAPYLRIDGSFTVATADVAWQAEKLYFTGHFNDTDCFAPPLLLAKAKTLTLRSNSNISTTASVSLGATQQLDLNSTITAGNIDLSGEDITFTGENPLTASKSFKIKAEENIYTSAGSKVTFESPQPVMMQCRHLRHYGVLTFDKMHMKVEDAIHVLGAQMRGNQLTIETKYLFAALSSFVIKDQFTVTSIASLLGLCRITSDFYSNTSMINLSCSLYTPATLNLSIKSGIGLCMAAANTAISVLHMVIHDPAAQGVLVISRFALNTIPALLNAAKIANDIHKTVQKPCDQAALIKLANQVKSLTMALASIGYSASGIVPQTIDFFSSHSPSFTPPNWDDTLTTINQINNTLSPFMAMAQPGKHVNSIVSLTVDANIGTLSVTDSSLMRINGDFVTASLLATQTSVISADINPVSIALTPGYTTEMGVVSYSLASKDILPVGAHSSRFLQIDSNALVPMTQHGVSMEADQIAFEKNQEYKHSSFSSNKSNVNRTLTLTDSSFHTGLLSDRGKIRAVHSQVAVQETHIDPKSRLELFQSQFSSGKKFRNEGEFIAVQSKIKIADIQNQGSSIALLSGSDLSVKNGNISKDSKIQIIATKLTVDDNVHVDGLFAADAGSSVIGNKIEFSPTAKVGFRGSDINIKVNTAVDFDLEIDTSAHYNSSEKPTSTHHHTHKPGHHMTQLNHSTHSHHHDHHTAKPEEAKPFQYHSTTPMTATIDSTGALVYHSPADTVTIEDRDIVSIIPIVVEAPNIKVMGHNRSDTTISLIGDKSVTFHKAHNEFEGLTVVADKVKILGGDTEVKQQVILRGNELMGSGKLVAGGKMSVQFTNVQIAGKKKVTHQEKVHHGFFSKKKETTTTTLFENADWQSGEQVVIEASDHMQITGVDIRAPEIDLIAKEMVGAELTGANSHTSDHSNLVHSHHRDDKTAVESASHLIGDKIVVVAKKLDSHAVDFISDDITVLASSAAFSRSILSTTTHETNTGLSITLPHLPTVQQLPGVDAIAPVFQAKDTTDTISAAVGVAAFVGNTTNTILDSARKKDPLSAIIPLSGINPSLTVSLGTKSSETCAQNSGEGYIVANHVHIKTQESLAFDNNYIIDAKGHSDIRTRDLNVNGVKLACNSHTTDTELMITTGLTGSDVGLSHSQDRTHVEHWQGDGMHFAELTLNADSAELLGEQIHVAKLDGHVKSLSSTSGVNSIDHSAVNGSVFSQGGFAYTSDVTHSHTVDPITPFIATSGSLDTAAKDFTVGSLDLTGQVDAGIHADISHQSSIPVHSTHSSVSLSGSWRDLWPSFNAIPSATNIVSLLHYQYAHDVMQGDTLHGIRESHSHQNVTLPIYHAGAAQKFMSNLHWFMQNSKPVATFIPAPQLTTEPRKTAQTPEEIKSSSTTLEIDFAGLYAEKQMSSPSALLMDDKPPSTYNRLTHFFTGDITSGTENSEDFELGIEYDPLELAEELHHDAHLFEETRHNLLNYLCSDPEDFLTVYNNSLEELYAKSSPICRALLPSADMPNNMLPAPLSPKFTPTYILERTAFSLDKVGLLKCGAYGLYAISMGMNLYMIWNAENRFEEICHIGAMTLVQGAGWELGSTVAATACVASGPWCPISLAVTGAVSMSIMGNYDWHGFQAKIEENMEHDKYAKPLPSILPISIFNFRDDQSWRVSNDLEKRPELRTMTHD
jgi:hypothetical protein